MGSHQVAVLHQIRPTAAPASEPELSSSQINRISSHSHHTVIHHLHSEQQIHLQYESCIQIESKKN